MGKAITIIVGAAMATIYSYSVAPQVVEMLNNANAILASVANR